MIPYTPQPTSARDATAALEQFFSLVDSGALFKSDDPAFYVALRTGLRNALSFLLVWGRPELDVDRGIMWPYEGFIRRHHVFEEAAAGDRSGFVREHARKFLAFLPFPGQWAWMLRIGGESAGDPEVESFLRREESDISEKIDLKPQNHYKLRHFCQVLKSFKSRNEKGVLRIFSLPYLFARHGLLSRLSKRYVIFVEPPMGVVFRHLWWRHFSVLEDPCIMGVSSMEDVLFLRGQHNIEPVRLAHGDFMEDAEPGARHSHKVYDIVFNATFDDMERKRHELMLRLLGHPQLQDVRALFLGRSSGSNVELFKKQVARYGLESRVTVMANLRRAEVPALLDRCRMGVHLSLYENACRCVYEFFRADIPCVISSCMGGINLDIFNESTGMAVPDSELPQAVSAVLENMDKYAPRNWFLANSGSADSTRKLNGILRGLFERLGYDWRSDIVPLGSSGASRYIDSSCLDDFRPELEWILACFRQTSTRLPTFSID